MACWMVGPSAMGSENGRPSSTTSAPPRTSARTYSFEDSGSGSPAATYETSAGPSAKAASTSLRVIEHLHRRRGVEVPAVALLDYGVEVLVAPPGDVDDHEVAQRFGFLLQVRQRVTRLQRGDDALQRREPVEGFEGGVVAHVDRRHPALVGEVGEFRSDPRVVETGAHAVGFQNLTVRV